MLTEFKNAMVVMDGKRVVAKARLLASGGGFWRLRIYGGEWIDPRAGVDPALFGKRMGRNILTVKGKAEARRILGDLAKA